MAILEVNENQKQIVLEYLEDLLSNLKSEGPYGSRSFELARIKDMEDIRDLMNQIKGAGCN